MKATTLRALWIGGLAAGAAAIGTGIYLATKPQTATAATAGAKAPIKLPTGVITVQSPAAAPPTPQTFDVSQVTSGAVSPGTRVTFQVPSGYVMNSISGPDATYSGGTTSFNFTANQSGTYVILYLYPSGQKYENDFALTVA